MQFQFQISPAAWFLAEANLGIVVILAAIADVAVKTEKATPDELLILWCLIGGFIGSFCSLRYFHPKSYWDASAQFGTNLCISAMGSPIMVDQISYWTSLPVGLRLALPVAFCVGVVGCNLTAMLIPYGEKYIRAYVEKFIPTKANLDKN